RMHIFNPKDLCVVEQVPALLEAGITSLRIEGRIKDAVYIGTATRVYRTVLDKAARLDSFAALEAKERLRLLSPSGITTGHYFRGVL
ncbi:MAG: U32 family peptidase, partial [Eubacteriales bacterium]|nr:U32 family peptidase [Eubacteriales bacterium]